MKKLFLVTLIIVTLFIIFTLVIKHQSNDIKNPTPCTDEAKICPDGSAVGRTGPNCKFAPCLGE